MSWRRMVMRQQSALGCLLAAQWNRKGVADVWWKCCWCLLFAPETKEMALDDKLLQLFKLRRKRQPFHDHWKPSRRPRRRS
jgi:hypothetical protein